MYDAQVLESMQVGGKDGVTGSWLQPLPALAVEDILEKETECNLSVSLSLYISILFQINKIIKNCNS